MSSFFESVFGSSPATPPQGSPASRGRGRGRGQARPRSLAARGRGGRKPSSAGKGSIQSADPGKVGQGKGPRMPSNPKQAFEMLDKSYFDEDFDPVKNLLTRLPGDPGQQASFIVNEQATSDMARDAVRSRLERAVMQKQDVFLRGGRMVQDIDLEVSRTVVHVKNVLRRLRGSREGLVSGALGMTRRRRRQDRLRALCERVRQVQRLSGVEAEAGRLCTGGCFAAAVEAIKSRQALADHRSYREIEALTPVRKRLQGGAALLVVRMRADQALDTLCRQFPDGVLSLAGDYASVVRAYAVLDKHGVAPGNALEDPDLVANQLADGAADEEGGVAGASGAEEARAAAVAALRMGMGAGEAGTSGAAGGAGDGDDGGGRLRRLRAGSALEGAVGTASGPGSAGDHMPGGVGASGGALGEAAALPGALEAAVASQLGLGGGDGGAATAALGGAPTVGGSKGQGLLAAAQGTTAAKSSLAQLPQRVLAAVLRSMKASTKEAVVDVLLTAERRAAMAALLRVRERERRAEQAMEGLLAAQKAQEEERKDLEDGAEEAETKEEHGEGHATTAGPGALVPSEVQLLSAPEHKADKRQVSRYRSSRNEHMTQRFDALCRQLQGPQIMPAFMRVCAAVIDALRLHVLLMRWHANADKLLLLAPASESGGSTPGQDEDEDEDEDGPTEEELKAEQEARLAAERQVVAWLHGGSDRPEEDAWRHLRQLPDPSDLPEGAGEGESWSPRGSGSPGRRQSAVAAVAAAAGFMGGSKKHSAVGGILGPNGRPVEEELLQESSAMREGLVRTAATQVREGLSELMRARSALWRQAQSRASTVLTMGCEGLGETTATHVWDVVHCIAMARDLCAVGAEFTSIRPEGIAREGGSAGAAGGGTAGSGAGAGDEDKTSDEDGELQGTSEGTFVPRKWWPSQGRYTHADSLRTGARLLCQSLVDSVHAVHSRKLRQLLAKEPWIAVPAPPDALRGVLASIRGGAESALGVGRGKRLVARLREMRRMGSFGGGTGTHGRVMLAQPGSSEDQAARALMTGAAEDQGGAGEGQHPAGEQGPSLLAGLPTRALRRRLRRTASAVAAAAEVAGVGEEGSAVSIRGDSVRPGDHDGVAAVGTGRLGRVFATWYAHDGSDVPSEATAEEALLLARGAGQQQQQGTGAGKGRGSLGRGRATSGGGVGGGRGGGRGRAASLLGGSHGFQPGSDGDGLDLGGVSEAGGPAHGWSQGNPFGEWCDGDIDGEAEVLEARAIRAREQWMERQRAALGDGSASGGAAARASVLDLGPGSAPPSSLGESGDGDGAAGAGAGASVNPPALLLRSRSMRHMGEGGGDSGDEDMEGLGTPLGSPTPSSPMRRGLSGSVRGQSGGAGGVGDEDDEDDEEILSEAESSDDEGPGAGSGAGAGSVGAMGGAAGASATSEVAASAKAAKSLDEWVLRKLGSPTVTQTGLNGIARPAAVYVGLIESMPQAASDAWRRLTQLVDAYLYVVATNFLHTGALRTLVTWSGGPRRVEERRTREPNAFDFIDEVPPELASRLGRRAAVAAARELALGSVDGAGSKFRGKGAGGTVGGLGTTGEVRDADLARCGGLGLVLARHRRRDPWHDPYQTLRVHLKRVALELMQGGQLGAQASREAAVAAEEAAKAKAASGGRDAQMAASGAAGEAAGPQAAGGFLPRLVDVKGVDLRSPDQAPGIVPRCVAVESLDFVLEVLGSALALVRGALPPARTESVDEYATEVTSAAVELQGLVYHSFVPVATPVAGELPGLVAGLKWKEVRDISRASKYTSRIGGSLAQQGLLLRAAAHGPAPSGGAGGGAAGTGGGSSSAAGTPTRRGGAAGAAAQAAAAQRKAYDQFRSLFPMAMPAKSWAGVWGCVTAHFMDRFVEGVSRVGSCTVEGRGLMALDASQVYAAVRRAGPLLQGCMPRGKEHVDLYIQAFYFSSQKDVLPWVQANRSRFPPRHLRALVANGIGQGMDKDKLEPLLATAEADAYARGDEEVPNDS